MTEFMVENWQYILVGFMIAEKLVKLSPAKWDDIIVDGIKSIVTQIKGIKK